ncbi:MAG TPA: S46 family peptidase [Bacteroidales bacterium]|nr:S46 family peptidase [Bacteroidales bacterium]HOS57316.1 S46 family peptidase [Bacteroidales bacterium]HRT13259.1 S46 family peptidase [Bacteroidales bacterium]
MKKIFLISVLALFIGKIGAMTPPDEGMWLPMFVKEYNYAEMQQLGLKLTPEQLYDINHSSLKDAIVQLGNFCTGEIISSDGLMLTNHHCGYASIAEHSSEEHDYLKYGFWAKTNEEELPNEGLTATFLVRMEDVTDTVLADVTNSDKKDERQTKIDKAIKKLVSENSENGKYQVVVKPFFEGNEYYMFVYSVYKDVRLVGAPPSSIGKFGDETDNWVWPRHTGDFSLFRIYTDKDGNPAEYSPSNIPLKPKHVLPISLKGVQADDFAMIWGFPGTTDRFMTSYEIRNMLEVDNAAFIKAFDIILPVIREEMNARDAVRIAYTSDYASMANTWKNKKGETASLIKLKVAEKKEKEEAELLKWINNDPQRVELYGNPFQSIQKTCEENNKDALTCFYYINLTLMNSKMLFTPHFLNGLKPYEKEKSFSQDKKERLLATYRENMEGTDLITEGKIIAATLELMATLPSEYQPVIFSHIEKKYKGNFEAFAQDAIKKSIVATEENLEKYLQKPSAKIYDNDPIIQYYSSMITLIFLTQHEYFNFTKKLETPRRKYLAAMKEMKNDTPLYPDANSTMRFTYGTVIGYYPVDGVFYNYYTTAKGVLEKEIPGDHEFDVPAKLKELILNKDFGRYAMPDGTLPVCFLTNNDITGGNSGSPVLNGKGELIGCAFDGNIEALSSNIAFDPDLQRCINVDIRYVLFVIDKFANAQRLIDEMIIVE